MIRYRSTASTSSIASVCSDVSIAGESCPGGQPQPVRRFFQVVALVGALLLVGCGDASERAERDRVIEEGQSATRWASASASSAMFAVHCSEGTASRRDLQSAVRWFEKQAAIPGLERYDRAELNRAAESLSCEPELADRLRAAIPE